MRLIETLRAQAHALRSLAACLEADLIRDELLSLRDRCERMADDVEREIAASTPGRRTG